MKTLQKNKMYRAPNLRQQNQAAKDVIIAHRIT